MQASGISHQSALQALHSLAASREATPANAAQQTTSAGQNLPGAPASSDLPLPPAPLTSWPSSQFDPGALTFLTNLQSSGSSSSGVTAQTVSLTQLDKGVTDLAYALKEIQSALGGAAQTQSAATASLSGASLIGTASIGATSLTRSALAELNALLGGLDRALDPKVALHRHHHRQDQGPSTDTASSGASSTTASAATTSASAGAVPSSDASGADTKTATG